MAETWATHVGDLMTRAVVTTSPQTKASDAALVIALRDITALPVLAEGRLVGMFTEANLLRLTGAPHTVRVGEVMEPVSMVTTPDAEVTALGRVMRSRRVLSVPVVRDGALVGIITRRDLERAGQGSGALHTNRVPPPATRSTVL